jgi:UDP-N-acetylglucosamine 4,6-dehydratase
MRSVLITGGSGGFGRAFVARHLARAVGGLRLCVYSRGEHAQANMRATFQNDDRLRFFIGDVRDRNRLTRAMEGCDTVIHAAALKRIEVGQYNPTEMVRTNIEGTMNVIDAALDTGVGQVIYLSSDKAYQPISPYGQSKALAEAIILAANAQGRTHYAITRYGNVSGSPGSVIPKWRALRDAGIDTVDVTDPECTRFWMAMDEAVDLVTNLAYSMRGGELAIPQLPAYRLGDLAEAMGMKMRVIGLPTWEKLHESMSADLCSADARRLSVDELRGALKNV